MQREIGNTRWFWRVCLFATILGLLGVSCRPPVDLTAVYYRFSPLVVDEGWMGDVILEVLVEGSPTDVKLELASTASEILLNDAGMDGDAVAGDDIYSVTLEAADVLAGLTPDDVNRNFVGYVWLYSGTDVAEQLNIFADILTDDIPPVTITGLTGSIQYTEHLVNMVDPDFFDDFEIAPLLQDFYAAFDDDYDFINLIYEISHFENRYHFGVRNDILGIGISVFDNTATYGSSGRLLGVTVFPIPTMFDGASPSYQHELGHQWINFISVPPLESGSPHWPLSDLARGLMGWGSGQGLTFSFHLVPVGDDYELVPDMEPKVYTDLSLYLIGLVPTGDVSEHFVFDDQSQTPAAGGTLSGPVTHVTIGDIVAGLGPRDPDSTEAQERFRVATIIVSRDGLLSGDVMRLYDTFSARAEEEQVLSYSSGLAKGQTNPFYLSTQELGQLDVRIKRHILVDASRDGGAWWYPQIGPFDPAADHQGRALADHFRSLGHTVLELPRPFEITAELLADFDIVIRAGGLGEYQDSEITAYRDYVEAGGSLWLLAEHGAGDGLAGSFGLEFEGTTRGENSLDNYVPHPITQGVGALFYPHGSGLTSHPATAEVLGTLSAASYLDLNDNEIQDLGEPSGPAVLGAMDYGQGRIVFCGDTNLWETVPQPLTDNVLQWFTAP